jgi:hypothetical protein
MLSGFSLVNFGNLILLAPDTLTRARPLSFLQVVHTGCVYRKPRLGRNGDEVRQG